MNHKILISGLINEEITVATDSFPIDYSPVEYSFFGVNSSIGGVGYNVLQALKKLGDSPDIYSLIGKDLTGEKIEVNIKRAGTSIRFLQKSLKKTPQSVILVDKQGARKIYCDLKDIQEQRYEGKPLDNYELAVLTNINFSRSFIAHCKNKKVKIATDVHCLSNTEDEYNKEFCENADILFLSNEYIKGREEEFVKDLYRTYKNDIIVIGCGSDGSLMYLGNLDKFIKVEAYAPRGIVSTTGAGDALFSAFIHFYLEHYDIDVALKLASLFAGYKIGEVGSANGFLSESDLLKLAKEYNII